MLLYLSQSRIISWCCGKGVVVIVIVDKDGIVVGASSVVGWSTGLVTSEQSTFSSGFGLSSKYGLLLVLLALFCVLQRSSSLSECFFPRGLFLVE